MNHPFSDALLARLGELGNWLLDNLRPTGTRRGTARTSTDAQALRDRLWTLLVRVHRTMRVAGCWCSVTSTSTTACREGAQADVEGDDDVVKDAAPVVT